MQVRGDFEALCKQWQKDLEYESTKGSGVSEETWVEFTALNKEKYNEIDQFLQIFHDWHHETKGQIKDKAELQSTSEKLKKKEQSSKELEKAQVQTQAILQAQASAQLSAEKENTRKKEEEENKKLIEDLGNLQELDKLRT